MERNETPTTETTEKPPMPATTLIAWREAMGFSQGDAAEALGCSRQSIINWEHGTNECPYYIGLAMSALALGMTPYGVNGKEENNNG